MIKMRDGGPDRLIAFVNDDLQGGRILLAEGVFFEEVSRHSWEMEDHLIPKAPHKGLMVLEGWIEVGPGDDPDVTFVGDWRQLTHMEMCRMRFGQSPWNGKATEGDARPRFWGE